MSALEHRPRIPRSGCCAAARSPRDPDLRALRVHHFDRAHDAIADAVAADTGEQPNGAGPQMFAAATIAMFEVVERFAAEGSDGQAIRELERGFAILQGLLAALS